MFHQTLMQPFGSIIYCTNKCLHVFRPVFLHLRPRCSYQSLFERDLESRPPLPTGDRVLTFDSTYISTPCKSTGSDTVNPERNGVTQRSYTVTPAPFPTVPTPNIHFEPWKETESKVFLHPGPHSQPWYACLALPCVTLHRPPTPTLNHDRNGV